MTKEECTPEYIDYKIRVLKFTKEEIDTKIKELKKIKESLNEKNKQDSDPLLSVS